MGVVNAVNGLEILSICYPWAQMSQGARSRPPGKAEPQDAGSTGDNRLCWERAVIALYKPLSDDGGT